MDELHRRAFLGGALASIFAVEGKTAPIPVGKESQLTQDSQKKELWKKESETYAEEMLSAYFALPGTSVESLTPYGRKVLIYTVKHFLYNGFSMNYRSPSEIFEREKNSIPLREVLTRVLEQTIDSSLTRVPQGALREVVINNIVLGIVMYLFKDAPTE